MDEIRPTSVPILIRTSGNSAKLMTDGILSTPCQSEDEIQNIPKILLLNIVHLSRVHSSHMQSLPGGRWWEEESEKSLEEESEIILGGAGFNEKEWEPVW